MHPHLTVIVTSRGRYQLLTLVCHSEAGAQPEIYQSELDSASMPVQS